MAYEEKTAAPAHSLILEGREKLSISGVSDVSGFDEGEIIMSTARGELRVRGTELHIEKLTLESGEIIIRGLISDLGYEEPAASGSLWARLFK